MTDQASRYAGASRPKARKFFRMLHNMSKNPAGLVLENEAEVKHRVQYGFGIVDPRVRGFARVPEDFKPLIRHVRKKGRKPVDLERFRGYWLVTEKVKTVFDALDPQAFEYMACDIAYDGGSPTVHGWLCDVVRMLDALDEQASDAGVHIDGSRTEYNLAGSRRLVFREDAVGPAHVFRLAFAPGAVICDSIMREACKVAGLRCITFIDAIHKVVAKSNRPA